MTRCCCPGICEISGKCRACEWRIGWSEVLAKGLKKVPDGFAEHRQLLQAILDLGAAAENY